MQRPPRSILTPDDRPSLAFLHWMVRHVRTGAILVQSDADPLANANPITLSH